MCFSFVLFGAVDGSHRIYLVNYRVKREKINKHIDMIDMI